MLLATNKVTSYPFFSTKSYTRASFAYKVLACFSRAVM